MEEDVKIGKFKKSWQLTKAAWQAIRLDKELFALPIIGFFISFAVVIPAGIAAIFNPNNVFYSATIMDNGAEGQVSIVGYISLVVLGLILACVSTFISGAVAHGAIERFKGNNPTIKSSLAGAWSHIGSLMAFTAFSYTIGYILSEIANRIPFIGGKIVVWLADAAWRVASFFAIPVIVTNEGSINPAQATKKSVQIIKQVWGESLIISATVGLVAILSFLGYFGLTIALFLVSGMLSLPGAIFVALGILALVGLIVLALVFSMLEAFVKAAIYYYAVTGQSPAHFNQQLLRQAFTPKKARKVFSA
jgi:hypothetical protein